MKKGFTFVEVLVTVAVLAVGIIAIFQAFFISLDYINHLTYRLYANILIENKMTFVQRQFAEGGDIPAIQKKGVERVRINNKTMNYSYSFDFKGVDSLPEILQVDLNLSWPERNRRMRMSRSAYVLLE